MRVKKKRCGIRIRQAVGLLLFGSLLFAFTGCGNESSQTAQKTEREVFAMDTFMKLTFYGDKGESAMKQVVREIYRLEKLFSVTKTDSDIARINAASGSAISVEPETYELVRRCKSFADETEGLFDISIYPVVKIWGFTTGQYRVPSSEECQMAVKKVDYKKIELLSGSRVRIRLDMAIDLGAAAKGYLSQRIMTMCREQGVESAIVSLGGNVQTMGKKPDGTSYTVGITDPADGTGLFGTMQVEDQAVITSGIYQRNFEKEGQFYHHIMDKRTGMPAKNSLASVTVIADEGDRADALATALYVMGEEKAREYQKKHPELQMVLIRQDGTYWQSAGAGMKRE